ncbi:MULTISPECIES: copper chaperone CopZ [Paenisporosarcina]|jgi:copper chaperone|uniref:Copper chaperone CopZ n=1 Tax=Paenisporosarcina quisquiliarum TaxID=365346 RepID=A0A9X3RCF7_9BACL|nr:copper chaperone CopZ [Paenisporosarcina quisquiliarum]MCZ8536715.1 copper chaperone CopZ [Paenisporosarcina quisquiliarum]
MVDHVTLKVEGMSCGHCVKAIESSVTEISGVDNVQVHLENGTVDVEFNKDVVEIEQITNTIEEQGYTIGK